MMRHYRLFFTRPLAPATPRVRLQFKNDERESLQMEDFACDAAGG